MHGLVTSEDPRCRRGDLELKLENPLGFFESERLVETNDVLLHALGCQWDRPPLLPACWDQPPLFDALQLHRSRLSVYALERSWVDKDPRLCITYPAYLHILLRRIPLVVALREPLAVATSLHARNGFSLNHGLILWWIYNFHIASQLCSDDLLLLYKDFLTFDEKTLQYRLCPFLEFHKHSRPSEDQARALIATLIRPEFNRSVTEINGHAASRMNTLLFEVCNSAYVNITQAGNQLKSFQSNSTPCHVQFWTVQYVSRLFLRLALICSTAVCNLLSLIPRIFPSRYSREIEIVNYFSVSFGSLRDPIVGE